MPLVTHKLVCYVRKAREKAARDRARCRVVKAAKISHHGVQQSEVGLRLRVSGFMDDHVEQNKHC